MHKLLGSGQYRQGMERGGCVDDTGYRVQIPNKYLDNAYHHLSYHSGIYHVYIQGRIQAGTLASTGVVEGGERNTLESQNLDEKGSSHATAAVTIGVSGLTYPNPLCKNSCTSSTSRMEKRKSMAKC
ncbi:hypothetical protein T310_8317 [Rasamsonia emersonii CBS 393.64]|uniref:Uncharacterized protein n=1 Tax=Rasamsonia emersonii (strain ATCC 16479 / CBS 393.64 / IMI 116815) TaxID=1408163 RepID=A0A0F4YIP8_RASE3|nr:hypothetical protein T310_8317 [Rasamsonia emersonii CBS 393.64]KKA17741.1 hypothetical protein T310_8317 [Rasamsonia emersonii CBS 393.64]